MTRISKEAQARQDRARRDGKFGEQHRNAPGFELTTAPDLNAALDAFGLTEGDLPGIASAWRMKFGILDGGIPDAPEDVVRSVLGTESRIHDRGATPRSDGSIVVSIYDSTENEHFDVALDGDEKRRYLVASEVAPERRHLEMLSQERDAIVSGETPIWRLFATEEEVAAAVEAVRAAQARQVAAARGFMAAKVDQLSMSAKASALALEEGRALTAAEECAFPTNSAGRREIGIYTRHRNIADYGSPLVLPGEVTSAATDWAECTKTFTQLDETLAQAHQLPEGALRTYLLDDRGEGSYDDPVTGKKRTYTKHSDLVSAHALAERNYEYAKRRRDEMLAAVATVAEAAEKMLTMKRDTADRVGRATQRLHEVGWPGDGPAPSRTKPYCEGEAW